jgi:crossover junction endonuclease MUS81
VLLLDYREAKKPSQEGLYNNLKHSGIQCEKRNLELGDIMWIARSGKRELVLDSIVERKRIEDLASSLDDGRYKEQKFRLKRSGLKNLIYLVEGIIDPQRMDLFETEMSATQVDGFFVQKTQNEDETAAYLINLTKHFMELSKQELALLSSGKSFEDFGNSASKSKNLTIADIFAKQLIQFSGCTPEKANGITALFKSPAILTSALNAENTDQLLVSLTYGAKKRKIGPALGKMISEFYVT